MSIELHDGLTWWEDLPYPDWERVAAVITDRGNDESQRKDWSDAARQWLTLIGDAVGDCSVEESPHFLLLVSNALEGRHTLPSYVEQCRETFERVIGDVADFAGVEKHVVLAFDSQDDYYRYVSYFHEEGPTGGSVGMHIRIGYPHVVTFGRDRRNVDPTVAHELTHVGLFARSMPLWLEEGLAQMFEVDMTASVPFLLDARTADRHRRYWKKHGLNAFWNGSGFSAPNRVQELSYQLAEILVRLLVSDARPRWFGWVQEPRLRFLSFLRTASELDYGAAAYLQHFGRTIDHLPARFLGDGDWTPPPSDDQGKSPMPAASFPRLYR
jgi:hypothetical protein